MSTTVEGYAWHRDITTVLDAEGLVRDGAVVCPWHSYTFDLTTGNCRTTATHRLRRYPVSIQDGVTVVEVPITVRRSWSEILRSHARGSGSR